MWIRLFPSPFSTDNLIDDMNTLTAQLERAGLPVDRSSAAVAALKRDKKVEIDLPDGVDLRELAETIPGLTIEAID